MEKKIFVRMAGQGDTGHIFDVAVKPGMTGNDVLTKCNLQGYWLSDMDNNRLPLEKSIYELVKDGQKLQASTAVEAGR